MNTENTTTDTPSKRTRRKPHVGEKSDQIVQTWANLAPENKFAGISRSEFQAATAPTRDLREEITQLKSTQKANVAKRMAADKTTAALLLAVVSGVKADAAFGVNSSLYRAMGFVPPSERKSRASTAALAPNGQQPRKRTRSILDRADRILDAWTQIAPESSFAGQNLAAVTAAIIPSRTFRATIAATKANLSGTVGRKKMADRDACKLIKRVVSAIKADRDFGSDSPLYRALGYVPDSEVRPRSNRKAGTSKAATPTPAPSSPVTTAS